MTGRRTVARLHKQLSPAEAYSALLMARERGDTTTARQIVGAMPAYDLVLQRSELMDWHEGLADAAGVFDRELQVALARSETLSIVDEFADAQREKMASVASHMYLCGVAAASGVVDSDAHLAKAADIAIAVLQKTESSTTRCREAASAARQSAADVVHGFDSMCQAVGVDPDVVVRSHAIIETSRLDDLREVPPSDNCEEWFYCFLEILYERVS